MSLHGCLHVYTRAHRTYCYHDAVSYVQKISDESIELPSSDVNKALSKHLYEMEDNTAEQYWEPAEEVALIFTQMNKALLLEIPRKLLQ